MAPPRDLKASPRDLEGGKTAATPDSRKSLDSGGRRRPSSDSGGRRRPSSDLRELSTERAREAAPLVDALLGCGKGERGFMSGSEDNEQVDELGDVHNDDAAGKKAAAAFEAEAGGGKEAPLFGGEPVGESAAESSESSHERLERLIGDLSTPFPFDEIEYNRCALQVSARTELEEIHSLFSFMRMGQVWITAGGRLLGVVTDSALIECCMAPPS